MVEAEECTHLVLGSATRTVSSTPPREEGVAIVCILITLAPSHSRKSSFVPCATVLTLLGWTGSSRPLPRVLSFLVRTGLSFPIDPSCPLLIFFVLLIVHLFPFSSCSLLASPFIPLLYCTENGYKTVVEALEAQFDFSVKAALQRQRHMRPLRVSSYLASLAC